MPNINDFKSKLRGGGARANQFRVTMPFPGYAAVGGETEEMSFLCTSLRNGSTIFLNCALVNSSLNSKS